VVWHQLLLARVVAIPDNGVVPLRVANLSTEVVTLHRGTTTGKFYPLSGTSVGDVEYCKVPTELAGDERSVHQIKVDLSAADFQGIDTTNMDQYQRGALEELVRNSLMFSLLASRIWAGQTWSTTALTRGTSLRAQSSRPLANYPFITNRKLATCWRKCNSKE